MACSYVAMLVGIDQLSSCRQEHTGNHRCELEKVIGGYQAFRLQAKEVMIIMLVVVVGVGIVVVAGVVVVGVVEVLGDKCTTWFSR